MASKNPLSRLVASFAVLAVLAPFSIAQSSDDSEIVRLGVYEVDASQDDGYRAVSTVSGTKTNVQLKDLAQNIQVLTRDLIEDFGALSLDESIMLNASVTADSIADGRYQIRGFQSLQAKRNGITSSQEARFDSAVIDRVEVIKGPAAVLYGVTQPGGQVNFLTKQPLSKAQSSIRTVVGSFNLFRTELDATGPLMGDGNGVNYRVVAAYENSDSHTWYHSTEKSVIAPSIRWNIGENTIWNSSIEIQSLDEVARRANPIQLPDRSGYLELPREAQPQGPESVYSSDVTIIENSFQHFINDNWSVRVVHSWLDNDYEEDELVGGALLGRGAANNTQLKLDALNRIPHRRANVVQLDVVGEIKTGNFTHKVIFGAEMEHENLRQKAYRQNNFVFFNPLDGPGPLANIVMPPSSSRPITAADFVRTQDVRGIYVLDQISSENGRFHATLGLRHDEIQIDSTFYNNNTSSSFVNDDYSPMAGVVFQPFSENDDISFYALYSESIFPNERTNPNGTGFPPQSGRGWEGGIKFDVNEGRVFGSVAAFEAYKTNIANGDPNNPGFWILSGEQKSSGFEADVIFAPNRNWQTILSYAYTDAFITEDIDNPNFVGQALASVPKNSFASWTKYEFTEGPMAGFYIGGGLTAKSDSPTNPNPVQDNLRNPSFSRVDLLIGWEGQIHGKDITINLNVKNLTDEYYIERFVEAGTNWVLSAKLSF